MTRGQRAVAAALVFACAAGLAGIALDGDGVRYSVFGAVEGVLALLLGSVLVTRRIWPRPESALGWVVLVYGVVATAQVLEFLLPPPGAVEWVVVAGLVFSSGALLAGGNRRRVLHALGAVAVLLTLLRYSVIPRLWRIGPESGAALGLGDVAEAVRTGLAEPRPTGPGAELIGLCAVALWALGTWLAWPDDDSAAERMDA